LAAPRPILVLPGYTTAHEKDLRSLAADLGTSGQIRFLDWVSDEDLEGLYALATVLAFPSLYEGFGLPPLEAMARGVPVLTSNRGALAEVVGDAAVVVEPESVQAIASGLRHILTDAEARLRLVAAGRRQAARFCWQRTVEETVATYRRLAPGLCPPLPPRPVA
jgi:glycosyltransferase involved in cell wall biosynthesis